MTRKSDWHDSLTGPTCKECKGSGKVLGVVCPTCGGFGK